MQTLIQNSAQAADRTNGHADELVSEAGRPLILAVNYAGIQREVAIFVPSRYTPTSALPLVFALHAGGHNASSMYAPQRRIVAHAENDGFIAVFPNGLPMPDEPDSHQYYWGDPINIDYMGFLLDELSARYTVDTSRIYFVGASGGSKLVYGLAAHPQISVRIAGVGTVAGQIGGKPTDPPDAEWEIIDPSVTGGCPMSAYLVQGVQDEKLPIAGGFGDEGDKIVVGFETKVAIWRHFVGARTEAPSPTPALPPSVTVRRWTNTQTGHAVVAVVDAASGHGWPDWDLMGELWHFFQAQPGR